MCGGNVIGKPMVCGRGVIICRCEPSAVNIVFKHVILKTHIVDVGLEFNEIYILVFAFADGLIVW